MTTPDSESPSSLARRLLEAATPGPWAISWLTDERGRTPAGVCSTGEQKRMIVLEVLESPVGQPKRRLADIDLIAAAPSLLTALLGELEEKRAEVAGLTHLLDHATDEAAEVDRLLDVLDEIARHDCCSEVTEVIRSALASLPTTTKTRSHDEGVQEC